MARCARLVLPETAHHVVARGVNRTRLFRSGFDKRRYLKRFASLAEEEGVVVHAYCLMSNHVHFLLTPQKPHALARLFQRLHTWWAGYFNTLTGRTGHLFQGRFHSSPLDEPHFWTAMRYIEVNPRRARLVNDVARWEYSSAAAHLSGEPDPIVQLAREAIERRRWGPRQWHEFLEKTDVERQEALRRCLRGCRPCGERDWIRGLEQRYRRKLAWTPPRRPFVAGP